MRKPPRVNDCGHADRPHYARGCCKSCYQSACNRRAFATETCRRCNASRVFGGSPFCLACGSTPDLLDIPHRFWAQVVVADDVPTDDPCWLWTGPRSSGGDGVFNLTTDGTRSSTTPCRVVYEAMGGELPYSTHTCRNKLCVNPTHIVGTATMAPPVDNQRWLRPASRWGAQPARRSVA